MRETGREKDRGTDHFCSTAASVQGRRSLFTCILFYLYDTNKWMGCKWIQCSPLNEIVFCLEIEDISVQRGWCRVSPSWTYIQAMLSLGAKPRGTVEIGEGQIMSPRKNETDTVPWMNCRDLRGGRNGSAEGTWKLPVGVWEGAELQHSLS